MINQKTICLYTLTIYNIIYIYYWKVDDIKKSIKKKSVCGNCNGDDGDGDCGSEMLGDVANE